MWRVLFFREYESMATVYKRTPDKADRRSCWYIGYCDHLGKRRTVRGFTDKSASERRASELEEEARQIRAGLKPVPVSTTKETMADTLQVFRGHLVNRDVGPKQISELVARVTRVAEACDWSTVQLIAADEAESQLGLLRCEGMSKQTSNHYLKALKQFTRWLGKTRRLKDDPLKELKSLNADTDRRHSRRALSPDELTRLVAAAEVGKVVESVAGPDRAMMYLIAAWTGFRKGEIGSLTHQSFELAADPPTVTVEALYSKRRRRDTQVLHPELGRRIAAWLEVKNKEPAVVLLPITARAGGYERKTAKMMRVDLAAARAAWIMEAQDDATRLECERSDFLKYQDRQNRFADLHANRHTFITNLGRAGVSPKTAQTLARHSDLRLTMNVYSHTELTEKQQAIHQMGKLWECSGSAPEAQIGKNGPVVSQSGRSESREPESEPSAEPVMPSEVDAAGQQLSSKERNTPRWARTSNLRFRRPMLYPIELGVRMEFSATELKIPTSFQR